MNFNEVIDIDLPSLQSIQLGHNALYGNLRKRNILTMRSINELIEND